MGGKSTWQEISLVESTKRCGLEARQMQEKGARAHQVQLHHPPRSSPPSPPDLLHPSRPSTTLHSFPVDVVPGGPLPVVW